MRISLAFVGNRKYTVLVQRYFNGGLAESATAYISVAGPAISSMTPLSGAGGTAFTIWGSYFGPYDSSLVNGKPSTRVTADGAVCALSLWNDTQIKGLIPDSVSYGTHTVLVERASSAGTAISNPVQFTVPGGGYGVSAASAFVRPKAVGAGGEHKAELSLSPEWGGSIESPARSAVIVPENALAEETIITIAPDAPSSAETARRETARKQAQLAAVGTAVSFGPEGLVFNADAELKLPYDYDKLPKGKTVSDLSVYWWDDNNSDWVKLPTETDGRLARLKAKTGHFSAYQVMAEGVIPQSADPAFVLGEVYVYPNPAKGGKVPVFHIETGIADSLKIKVYTVSGMVTHEYTLTGLPQVLSIGGNLVYAYEYAWEGHIASGVYYYVIEAQKAGSKLKKSGKFAVVR